MQNKLHRRSAVAIRHVAFEDLGLLSPLLDAAEWDVSFCDAAVDDALAAVAVKLSAEEIASLEKPYVPHAIAGYI